MANLSFLDLMLAEALASGLAREARRAERPPPDNFFLLPPDPDAWRKIREASKKESMVVCIEFTDNSNENCRRVQSVFMDLAREFDGIPFVRAVISPGCTYVEMRADLGGVQFTPTILMVFYGDGSVQRAKFEGTKEIGEGLNSGRIKAVIKELIDRRVKLKLAERMTEQVITHLGDRERQIREEYESKLERQMKEKEEEFQKREEERIRKEQEEDQKARLVRDKLRKQREDHLDELLQMDLDSSSVKELKVIMGKVGVSSVGCLSKQDLKDKLYKEVPELRISRSRPNAPRSHNSSMSDDDHAESIDSLESSRLSKDLEQARNSLTQKDKEIRGLRDQVQDLERSLRAKTGGDKEIRGLKDQVQDLERRLRAKTGGSTGNGESSKVKELETSLLETRMLYTTSLEDFKILDIIHDSKMDRDCDSLILRVKCIKPHIPNPDRTYAMKVLTDYFKTQTQTQVRQEFQNEYQVLCQLPPHRNVIHMWAFFYDRPGTPDVIKFFKRAGNESRSMGLFILMEEHLMSLGDHIAILVDNRGPKATSVVAWLKDLLTGLVFLQQHSVVHRDLKLGNLLLASDGRVVVSDFGKAIEMEEGHFSIKHTHGFDIGGNHAHLAPEVLNSRPPRSMLDYSKQPVWAAGVLAYELAGHHSPFAAGSIDQRGYRVTDLPPLEYTHCRNNSYNEKLSRGLTRLVSSMLAPDPGDRPSLQECLDTINNI